MNKSNVISLESLFQFIKVHEKNKNCCDDSFFVKIEFYHNLFDFYGYYNINPLNWITCIKIEEFLRNGLEYYLFLLAKSVFTKDDIYSNIEKKCNFEWVYDHYSRLVSRSVSLDTWCLNGGVAERHISSFILLEVSRKNKNNDNLCIRKKAFFEGCALLRKNKYHF